MIGHLGRYLDIRYALRPVVVITMMAAAMFFIEASTAAIATVVVESVGIGVFMLNSMN